MTIQHRRMILLAGNLLWILLAGCTPLAPEPAGLTTPKETATSIVWLPKSSPTVRPVATSSPAPSPSAAQTAVKTPDPASHIWAAVASGLRAPIDIQNARDGSGRLFIVEQPGRIRILKNGQLLERPFLDITKRVGSRGSEQGLLGLAFHPDFIKNGYFFVNYTDHEGNTHIARFTGSGDNADPASEKKLLFVQQPFPNHNGGALAFGPDGYLYIGLGDGGSGGDPYGNAQSPNTLLGKMLRLDVDGADPYAIPADNPYATNGQGYKEIWASGLRNPWRFSFDRQTGDLWIGDVGQNQWEEIDFVPAGAPGGLNFGWNKLEGTHPYKGSNQPGLSAPVVEYPHGQGCAVTGGAAYRGTALPAWQGIYFFGDYCSGAIWGLPSPPGKDQPILLFQTGFKISSFGSDEAGELFVADYGGAVYQLELSK